MHIAVWLLHLSLNLSKYLKALHTRRGWQSSGITSPWMNDPLLLDIYCWHQIGISSDGQWVVDVI